MTACLLSHRLITQCIGSEIVGDPKAFWESRSAKDSDSICDILKIIKIEICPRLARDRYSELTQQPKRGLVATAAIIALLVAVVGVGVADYYVTSNRVATETSISTTTTSIHELVTRTETETNTQLLTEATTQYSFSTLTSISVSDKTVTPSTTITVIQTSGNISEITPAEAVLHAGDTATALSASSASLLVGFYNPNSTTYITSIILEGSNFAPITVWDNSSAASTRANLFPFSSMQIDNTVTKGLTSVVTVYPSTATVTAIEPGSICQYVVFFASGAYVEGNLTAQ